MLPPTTKEYYLTGMTAMNIPNPEEDTGDWHFQAAFFGWKDRKSKIFVAGIAGAYDTNDILKDFGIQECHEKLRGMGVPIPESQPVYAANHYRAMLDMLLDCVKKGKYPYHLDIDEWFNTEKQQNFVLSMARNFESHLPKDEWEILDKWIKAQQDRVVDSNS
jgi:hypothetical protein